VGGGVRSFRNRRGVRSVPSPPLQDRSVPPNPTGQVRTPFKPSGSDCFRVSRFVAEHNCSNPTTSRGEMLGVSKRGQPKPILFGVNIRVHTCKYLCVRVSNVFAFICICAGVCVWLCAWLSVYVAVCVCFCFYALSVSVSVSVFSVPVYVSV